MTDPIPAGVYFNIGNDNFYCVERGHGCGMAFFQEWKPRWEEFPIWKEGAIALREVEAVSLAISDALSEAYAEREQPSDEDHRKAAIAAIAALDALRSPSVSRPQSGGPQ